MRNISCSVLTPLYIHTFSLHPIQSIFRYQRTLNNMSTLSTALLASTEGARDSGKALPLLLILQELVKNKGAGNLIDLQPTTLQESVTLPTSPEPPLLQSYNLSPSPNISASSEDPIQRARTDDKTPVSEHQTTSHLVSIPEPKTTEYNIGDRLLGNQRDSTLSKIRGDVYDEAETEESLFKLSGELLDTSLIMELGLKDIQMPKQEADEEDADFKKCMRDYNTMMAE
jgi:hypothetical protein